MPQASIALFGASGRTGRCVAEVASKRGLVVRGLVRRAGSAQVGDGGVVELVGELEDSGAVAETLKGCGAACIVFGPRPPFTDLFCGPATESIVSVMRELEVERLICQTGAMIGDYSQNRTAVFQLAARIYQRRSPGPHRDRMDQERIVRESGLGWTLLKPPRLTEARGKGDPEAAPDLKVGLMSSVSRIDLARLIVSEVLTPRFVNETVFVRSGRGA